MAALTQLPLVARVATNVVSPDNTKVYIVLGIAGSDAKGTFANDANCTYLRLPPILLSAYPNAATDFAVGAIVPLPLQPSPPSSPPSST